MSYRKQAAAALGELRASVSPLTFNLFRQTMRATIQEKIPRTKPKTRMLAKLFMVTGGMIMLAALAQSKGERDRQAES